MQISVRLLDEGVEVWRPVEAELLEGGEYEISPQPYDRQDELWEFESGDRVVCELGDGDEGPVLAAVRRS